MGTKQNPKPNDCYEKAEMDEPMFVLLARDPMAPVLVRLWAEARRVAARSDKDIEKADEAYICASEMEMWACDHPDHGFLSKREEPKCAICGCPHDNDLLTDICRACEQRIQDEGSP